MPLTRNKMQRTEITGFCHIAIICLFSILQFNGGVSSVAYGAQYVDGPGTLALWHMDEGSGNTIVDATDNGNDGTFVGGLVEGAYREPSFQLGAARYGASGVRIPRSAPVSPPYPVPGYESTPLGIDFPVALTNRNDFTFQLNMAWTGSATELRPGDNLAGYLYYDFDSFGVRGHIGAGGNIYLKALHRFDDGWHELNSTTLLSSWTWYDVAFTREQINATQTEIKIIIDGVDSNSMTFTNTAYTSGTNPGFGYLDSGYDFTMPCDIDEARVLDYVGTPPPPLPCGGKGYPTGDFNQDCNVDILDLNDMVDEWLSCTPPLDTDIYIDGCVNFKDYALFANEYPTPTSDLLVFQNDDYYCSLIVGTDEDEDLGLSWKQMYHKSTGSQYLYSDDNGPIFKIFGDGID